MKKALISAVLIMLLITGCDNNSYGGSSVTATDSDIQNTTSAQDRLDTWERDIYIDDLHNKYVQFVNDEEAFYNIYYYVENDDDVNNAIAAAEKCLLSLEALVAVEAPDMLIHYHEDLVKGVQRERKHYKNLISLMSYASGHSMLTDEEIEQINKALGEYFNTEASPLGDAFIAVVDAAYSY